ncbi:Hypothetical_protein [Hexamita inflata]|uniref:Hypothetical_protein n=1 Tax=Hexamita inflata TaxID=28002 RepID=A0AA86UL79_9EUKA|nr:Hypothetical protein HINF_LOCUS43300 [Hexamita inflata]CAI9955662.1 Hypothetical protein HINF_LOCUS43307 [Hexamita inflata]
MFSYPIETQVLYIYLQTIVPIESAVVVNQTTQDWTAFWLFSVVQISLIAKHQSATCITFLVSHNIQESLTQKRGFEWISTVCTWTLSAQSLLLTVDPDHHM